MTYRITAQNFTSSQRIARTIQAVSQSQALLIATAEIGSGFYVIDIQPVGMA